MHKYIIVLIIFFIASLNIQAQVIDIKVNYVPADTKDKLIISYEPGNKLTWKDFQGIKNDDVSSAITSSGIGYHFNLHRTEDSAWFTFTVNCTFSKTKSWVLPDKKTDYILQHEQNHFDISYIHALLFIKMLRATDLTITDYKTTLQREYREISAALNAMQNQYDTESKNGMDTVKQEEWNKKIADQLGNLQIEVIDAVR